jgi:hypothetical protein
MSTPVSGRAIVASSLICLSLPFELKPSKPPDCCRLGRGCTFCASHQTDRRAERRGQFARKLILANKGMVGNSPFILQRMGRLRPKRLRPHDSFDLEIERPTRWRPVPLRVVANFSMGHLQADLPGSSPHAPLICTNQGLSRRPLLVLNNLALWLRHRA